MKPADVARYIDHTLLKPEATRKQINQLCSEARLHYFASVCVNPTWVPFCSYSLSGTNTRVGAVVGFPLGSNMSGVKADEALLAARNGAHEIDMVLNIGALKDGRVGFVFNDIAAVRRKASWVILKVIIETCLLTDHEKALACLVARDAGADFVKTSTGFSTGGATVEDVALMRKTVGEKMGVKASGGIKDFATARAMIEAGADRLGCSNSVAIVTTPS